MICEKLLKEDDEVFSLSLYFNGDEYYGIHDEEIFLNHISMHATKIIKTCFYLRHSFMYEKEIKEPWIILNGEKILELEIEKFLCQ